MPLQFQQVPEWDSWENQGGNIAAAAVISVLLRKGFTVLNPFGDGAGYDLAYDDGVAITRVQAKMGHFARGVIRFNTASIKRSGERVGYVGRADQFDVVL